MESRGRYGGYRAALSLTFDDGTKNQLERAVPILDEYGLKATFYLHARDDLISRHSASWRAVAETGHEIGNHTKSHWCPNAIHERRGGLEDMTLSDVETDILEAHERLITIAPHQTDWTFAYPCGAMYVGRGETRQSYVPVVARHFLAGRSVGEYGFGNDPETMDAAALLSIRVERMSGFEIIGLVEEITGAGRWAILCLHDISGFRLSVEEEEYRRLLRYLADRKSEIAVAPVVDVMKTLLP